jgi:hypothetical protein
MKALVEFIREAQKENAIYILRTFLNFYPNQVKISDDNFSLNLEDWEEVSIKDARSSDYPAIVINVDTDTVWVKTSKDGSINGGKDWLKYVKAERGFDTNLRQPYKKPNPVTSGVAFVCTSNSGSGSVDNKFGDESFTRKWVSTFVNSVEDKLQPWLEDNNTIVITNYLEPIVDASKLTRIERNEVLYFARLYFKLSYVGAGGGATHYGSAKDQGTNLRMYLLDDPNIRASINIKRVAQSLRKLDIAPEVRKPLETFISLLDQVWN